MVAVFVGKKIGDNGRLYRSRITGRDYIVTSHGRQVSAYCNGRRLYGGESRARAFRMIELEDCVA
jgi:hypothetical protein